jgi:hypothetical protein
MTDTAATAPPPADVTRSDANSNVPGVHIGTSDDAPRGLQDIYDALVQKAETAMKWYETRQQAKKRAARYVRSAAILLGALTAVIPSIIAMLPDRISLWNITDFPVVRLNPIATITGVAAATAILFDRFYGFSSSWGRFVTTYQEIQRNLDEFRIGWRKQILKLNSNIPPTDEQVVAVYDFLGAFLNSVNDSIRNETQGWLTEFKVAVDDIDKTVETQKSGAIAAAAAAPAMAKGAIAVVVNGVDSLEGSQWTLQLDNRREDTKIGQSTASIPLLDPGIYRVRIGGKREGKPVAAEYAVRVTPGEVVSLKVEKLG